MSGSDWSPDTETSDSEIGTSAINDRFVEHLTHQHPPRVTQRRRSRTPESAATLKRGRDAVVVVVGDDEPPPQQARIDVASLIEAALTQGDVELLPAGTTLRQLATSIVGALRRSSSGGEVARAVTHALADPLNVELREAVLTGKMSAEALVALDEVSLLNPTARAAREAARIERLNQSSVEYLEKLSLTKTTMFTCPACGSRECYANFRSTDFVKWQGDDQTPTLLRCCKCSHSFRQ